jgi:hypothetical protein
VIREPAADVAAGSRVSRRIDRLVDEAVDAYVEWREESTAVWDAYGRWVRATAVDAPLAFSAYRAAVDREECASQAYANFMKRIATTLSAGPPGCEPDDRAKPRRVEVTISEGAQRPPSSSGRSLGWHLLAWGGRIALVALFVFASISIAAHA